MSATQEVPSELVHHAGLSASPVPCVWLGLEEI